MKSNDLASIVRPEITTLLDQLRQEIFSGLNCHQVGQIVSFNPAKQTSTVEIMMNRIVGSKTVQYPLLVQCPTYVMQGGGGRITFPITPGDSCLVLFNDRSIDTWSIANTKDVPPTARLHSMSDGLVIVGFRPEANPLQNYNLTDSEWEYSGGKILVGDKLALRNQLQSLKTVMDLMITAMTTLNTKTGPSAATQIATAQTAISDLLKT